MRLANSQPTTRRATVTVIVVAFLALFAVLGLTFLISSQRFATASRLNRESMNRERDNPPQPDVIMQQAMNDILYDALDDASGAFKPTRGWSFARLMYGQHPGFQNTLPYSGIGRNRNNVLPAAVCTALGLPANTPDYTLLNYTYFPSDGFVRDPERAGPNAGIRANPTAPISAGDTYWPINANYTSADENNPYLAVIDPTTGRVLLPSFHRPSCFGGTSASDVWGLANTNPNWSNKVGKYMTFRPRPADHSPAFPYPKANADGKTYGDVENLVGKRDASGNPITQYDSLWMDLDLPVAYWRGKRYKPLVAFLITDLDNRVNVNTAGNLRSKDASGNFVHGSNQNWGPWEVNLEDTAIFPGGNGDVVRLLRGYDAPGTLGTAGRYGGNTATSTANAHVFASTSTLPPGAGYSAYGPYQKRFATYSGEIADNNPVGGYLPHFYAPVDLDAGVSSLTANNFWRNPNPGAVNAPYEAFQVFGSQRALASTTPNLTNRYWNGQSSTETPVPAYTERLNFPGLFNPYLNPLNQTQNTNTITPKTFAPSEMLALNARYVPQNTAIHPITGGNTLNSSPNLQRSDIAKLTTLGLNVNAAGRFRITTISNDLDRPGATPWLNTNAGPAVAPSFTNTFPYFANQNATGNTAFSTTTGNGDYDTARFQSLATVLGGVDLNRPLTEYRTNINAPFSVANLNASNVAQAVLDRQNLASDIYLRLRAATGTPDPSTLTPSTPTVPNAQYEAAKLLAQLAVNIVDYIDNDDYSTPFNWNPSTSGATPNPADATGNLDTTNTPQLWVFGHELPRLVVNEAFVRLENDPNEPDITNPPMMGNRTAQKPYKMRVWAELHNTLTPRDAAEIGNLADSGAAQLVNANGAVYRMRLVKSSGKALQALVNPGNAGGEPPASELLVATPATLNQTPANTVTQVFPNVITGLPSQATGYANTNVAQPSFYIAGPAGDATGGNLPKLPDTSATPAHGQFDNFEYNVNSTGGSPGLEPNAVISDPTWSPIIVLQRLANEHLPPSATNPYITVDTFMPGNYSAFANPDVLPTVDLTTPTNGLQGVSIVQDRVQITPTVDRIKTMMVPKYDTLYSFGKRQPYAGRMNIPAPSTDTNYKQNPSNLTPGDGNIRQTFNRHNGLDQTGAIVANDTLDRTAAQGFTPMVHLDRAVTSVAELLNVSQFGPHMVTPLFYKNNSNAMVYQAGWLRPESLLYRSFDLLTTRGKFHGQGFGGRTPGKVNINTVTDRAVIDAIADKGHLGGTNGKSYQTTDVDAFWNQVLAVRGLSETNLLAGTTKPILGTMSPVTNAGLDPQYPSGVSSTLTIPGIVRDSTLSTDRARQELLQTLYPNLTTRSNTFAVYATIGFFEVINPGTGPDGLTYPDANGNRPQLGAEIIGVDGKAVRYKYFAVVDRSQLSIDTSGNKLQGIGTPYFAYEPVRYGNALPTTNPVTSTTPDPQPTSGAIMVTVAIPRTSFTGGVAVGNYDGITWKLKVNDPFVLEYNPDSGPGFGNITGNSYLPTVNGSRNRQETVTVQAIEDDPPGNRVLISFPISKPHARGSGMLMLRPDQNTFPFIAQPGNPGTQKSTFSLGANTYRSVVPVFERVDGY